MAIPDATSVAQKWAQRAQGAAQDYAQGVASTDKDPTALAIAAGPLYLARVQEAFNSGKWANGLRRAGKAGWQQAVASKGAANYGTGIAAAVDKYTQALVPLLAYESNLQSRILAMPNTSDVDKRNRMLAWFDGMRQYQRPA